MHTHTRTHTGTTLRLFDYTGLLKEGKRQTVAEKRKARLNFKGAAIGVQSKFDRS